MRNYKLTISYDGTNYKGWQRQSATEQTVQGILESTAARLLGYAVEIDGSGRTDSGVHAVGQVANMSTAGKVSENFVEQWNAILPDDIRIRSAELVKNSFHGRYSAVGKHYCYVVDTGEKAGVFSRKYTCHYPHKLDLAVMRSGARHLTGKHDFSAFTDDKSDKSKVREIYKIEIQKKDEIYLFHFWGDGFMYHMVRLISGELLKLGRGECSESRIKEMLNNGCRGEGGFLAPAKGLFLVEVDYR